MHVPNVKGVDYCLKVFPDKGEPYEIRLFYEGYTVLTEASAKEWYQYMKDFWSSRQNQKEEDKEEALQDYVGVFEKNPSRKDVAEYIKQLEPESIIDFGGATGGLYGFLDDYGIRYTNVEPYAPFIKRQLEDYPWTRGAIMDAEAFIKDFEVEEPYDVFFASVSLCMVAPEVTRQVLKKATEVAQRIVIWDFGENRWGEITPEPALYAYAPNTPLGFNFAHQYGLYLEALGLSVVHEAETAEHGAIWGHYIIHAEK